MAEPAPSDAPSVSSCASSVGGVSRRARNRNVGSGREPLLDCHSGLPSQGEPGASRSRFQGYVGKDLKVWESALVIHRIQTCVDTLVVAPRQVRNEVRARRQTEEANAARVKLEAVVVGRPPAHEPDRALCVHKWRLSPRQATKVGTKVACRPYRRHAIFENEDRHVPRGAEPL